MLPFSFQKWLTFFSNLISQYQDIMISNWRCNCEQNEHSDIRENNVPVTSSARNLQPNDGRGSKEKEE